MERFNPELTLTSSETATLLEVHPSTVKRWCNEGEIPSEKTDGGHRRIHLEDAMSFARAKGIDTVLSPFHPYEPHVWSALNDVRLNGSYVRLHTLAMGWIVRGQLRRLSLLYDTVARDPSVPLCGLCDEGIRGLMVQVGEAWMEGRLRAGEEHMVSQVMVEVLLKLRVDQQDLRKPSQNGSPPKTAIVGTLEGNQHHLGSLCIRVMLERLGWDVYYLGPDVPIEDFGIIQRGRNASLVCISLTPPATAGDVARSVRMLGEFYDSGQPYALALGGAVPADINPDLLQGPFADVEIFNQCSAFRESLQAGFAPTGGRRSA